MIALKTAGEVGGIPKFQGPGHFLDRGSFGEKKGGLNEAKFVEPILRGSAKEIAEIAFEMAQRDAIYLG
jgi:hypothetical protein